MSSTIALLAAYLAFAPLAAFAYAFLWPTVPARAGLFITLGTALGIIIAVGAVSWVAMPLAGIGIARAAPGQRSDTLWSVLGQRLLVGALIEVGAVCFLLFLLARWLRSP
jgi:uncharacterized membrane protein (DUF485 family)